MKKTSLIYLVALICASLYNLSAQQSLVPPTDLLFTDLTDIHIGIESKSLSIGDRSFTQIAFPVSLVIPLTQTIMLRASNIPSSTSADSVKTLSGLSDTQIGLSYFLPDEHILFISDINLPSGKKAASREKQLLNSVVGFNALGYQVQSFGQGFDFQIGAAGALELSSEMMGNIGAAFLSRGEYQPVDTLGQYKPGNEFTLDVGANYQYSRRGEASLDAALTFYGSDYLTSVDTQGNSINSPYVIRKARTRFSINARFGFITENIAEHIILLKARFRLGSDEIMIANATLSNGPQIELRYAGSIPFAEGSHWFFKPYTHIAYFSSSEYRPLITQPIQFHDVLLFTPGIGLGITIHSFFKAEGNVRYTMGNARVEQTREHVHGFTSNLSGSIFF